MRIGMVGLGRMGGNMTKRLLRSGHEVVGYARSADSIVAAEREGAIGAHSLEEVVANLDPRRAIWLMIPAGDPTEEAVTKLADLLDAGDVVVDGGNSRYTDSVRRAKTLAEHDISFIDAGTSGGIWGLDNGYCLMVGGDDDSVERLRPIFEALAPEDGFAHVGPPGAGHFTKMVHNGIEYALMQAYGEGFELLHSSEFELDIGQIAELWNHGSVVRSWLLELAAHAFESDPELADVAPYIEDSGEGRWTLEHAINNAVPVPTIATALFARFASRQDASFGGKVIAALRKEFGGHSVQKPSGE
ncbi:MAG: phosphogluconate dehydrogenase (NAD(+)-dependent, decarboxylating) [Actinomycetota bacterium]